VRKTMIGLGAVIALALVGHAALAQLSEVVLPPGSPFPESVAAAPDGTLYASSISNGGIARALPGVREATPWIEPGAFATRSTFGVQVDAPRHLLWVCSNDASGLGLKGPSDVKGSWLKAFDLATGAGKISVALPPGPAICNDAAFSADGSVYVTNTAAPQILRLAPGGTKLAIWLTDKSLAGGLDGIAFDVNGNLYVDTYVTGELFRIMVKNGAAVKVTKLTTSRLLTHADGMKFALGHLLMVEGGGTLDRVTVTGDAAKVDTLHHFDGPTGLGVIGRTVWVSEGQLQLLADAGKPGNKLPVFRLRAFSMPAE
jgi:sugar lactone lactonase YvrE